MRIKSLKKHRKKYPNIHKSYGEKRDRDLKKYCFEKEVESVKEVESEV